MTKRYNIYICRRGSGQPDARPEHVVAVESGRTALRPGLQLRLLPARCPRAPGFRPGLPQQVGLGFRKPEMVELLFELCF